MRTCVAVGAASRYRTRHRESYVSRTRAKIRFTARVIRAVVEKPRKIRLRRRIVRSVLLRAGPGEADPHLGGRA